MFDSIIIHYDEIGLKGKNRKYFEDMLIRNIKKKIKKKTHQKETGLISFKSTNQEKEEEILKRIPGIAYFSFAKKTNLNLEQIKKDSKKLLKKIEFKSFKVNTERRDKQFKIKSPEINRLVGEVIYEDLNKKVELRNPEVTLTIEITNKAVYLSTEKIQGVGGLPTNPKNKVTCLLSGGFDSPVAAYTLMKRGCEAIFVHFQNKTQLKDSVKDKVISLTKQLSKYQQSTKLYIVPFADIQKELITKVKPEMRMLVYRRFMIKIASKIADLNNSLFLITGDSLSQVASQTLENLNATYQGSDKIILSPLIGMNKLEIINISKQIGTYSISKLPYGDCCSFFLPKHPKLKTKPFVLDNIEKNFDVEKLIEKAVKKTKVKEF